MSAKNPDLSRSDAKLLRLPISVMREIVRRAAEPNTRLVDILAWLKSEHGVSCSASTLSDNLSSLTRRVRSAEREDAIQDWMRDEKALHPELTDEAIFAQGQRKFSLITIAEEDIDGWSKIMAGNAEAEKLRLKQKDGERAEKRLILEREKFELEFCEKILDQATREAAERIAGSNLSNADKIAAMRKEAFKSVDELQASGKVVIPK